MNVRISAAFLDELGVRSRSKNPMRKEVREVREGQGRGQMGTVNAISDMIYTLVYEPRRILNKVCYFFEDRHGQTRKRRRVRYEPGKVRRL